MLAEHVSSASVDDPQRKLIGGRWEEDSIPSYPDIVKQLIKEGKVVPFSSCDDFQHSWFSIRNRVYVKSGDPEPADVALGMHEGSCQNPICRELSVGSDELRKATSKHPRKNARYIKGLQKWVKTEQSKLNKPPIVVNPVPFR